MNRTEQDILGIIFIEPWPILVLCFLKCRKRCFSFNYKFLRLKTLYYFLSAIAMMYIKVNNCNFPNKDYEVVIT